MLKNIVFFSLLFFFEDIYFNVYYYATSDLDAPLYKHSVCNPWHWLLDTVYQLDHGICSWCIQLS